MIDERIEGPTGDVRVLTLVIGNRYKDSNGTVWKCVGNETRGWRLTTGSPPLTKIHYYDENGKPLSSMSFPLVVDLGPEPITTVVTDDELKDLVGGLDGQVPIPPTATIPLIIPGVCFPHSEYAKLEEETFDNLRELARLKGAEYSGDTDRLANFRRNAADTDTSMELVWRIYAAKHWDAIGQYIRDVQSGTTRTRLEGLSGRCDDLIVYLLLFKAMLIEAGVK